MKCFIVTFYSSSSFYFFNFTNFSVNCVLAKEALLSLLSNFVLEVFSNYLMIRKFGQIFKNVCQSKCTTFSRKAGGKLYFLTLV